MKIAGNDTHNRLSSWLAALVVLALHGAAFAALLWGQKPQPVVLATDGVITVQLLDISKPDKQNILRPTPRDPQIAAALTALSPPALALHWHTHIPAAETDRAITTPPEASAPSLQHDEILRRYAAEIWKRIIAHKPAGFHRHGTALMTFRLNQQGAIVSLSMTHSSGDALLDARALAAIRRASPFDPPPAGLRPDELVFTIPLEFS